eukprot:Pgem_evm1s12037
MGDTSCLLQNFQSNIFDLEDMIEDLIQEAVTITGTKSLALNNTTDLPQIQHEQNTVLNELSNISLNSDNSDQDIYIAKESNDIVVAVDAIKTTTTATATTTATTTNTNNNLDDLDDEDNDDNATGDLLLNTILYEVQKMTKEDEDLYEDYITIENNQKQAQLNDIKVRAFLHRTLEENKIMKKYRTLQLQEQYAQLEENNNNDDSDSDNDCIDDDVYDFEEATEAKTRDQSVCFIGSLGVDKLQMKSYLDVLTQEVEIIANILADNSDSVSPLTTISTTTPTNGVSTINFSCDVNGGSQKECNDLSEGFIVDIVEIIEKRIIEERFKLMNIYKHILKENQIEVFSSVYGDQHLQLEKLNQFSTSRFKDDSIIEFTITKNQWESIRQKKQNKTKSVSVINEKEPIKLVLSKRKEKAISFDFRKKRDDKKFKKKLDDWNNSKQK